MSERALWTVIHGMGLGTLFLATFAAGLAGLYRLRPEPHVTSGLRERIPRLAIGTWLMAVVAWLTVIIGTYIVYPWYRAGVPDSARSRLLANPETALWHTFG